MPRRGDGTEDDRLGRGRRRLRRQPERRPRCFVEGRRASLRWLGRVEGPVREAWRLGREVREESSDGLGSRGPGELCFCF